MKTWGTCVVERLADDMLWVQRADRSILISDGMLNAIRGNPPGHAAQYEEGCVVIYGLNETVRYRLTGVQLAAGEWPAVRA